jgi:replicative superfamily II helicase
MTIRDEYPDKSFIYGVFAKTFGTKLERALRSEGIEVEFHNADKQKDTKDKIERKFRMGQLKDLVATKTLAVGMNLPAGHVVITAASNAGGDIRAYELNQFAGRAGRPQFETEGHAHFLLPAAEMDYHINRIENGEPVCSQLKTVNDVALHFLGAMYIGRIRTSDDFIHWFQRTLRNYQNPIPLLTLHEILADIISEMEVRGMIKKEEDGNLKLRKRGMICAQMGIDPYYLFELVCNFQKYLAFPNPNDIALAKALGECSEFFSPIYKNTAQFFDIPHEIQINTSDGYMQSVAAYYKKFLQRYGTCRAVPSTTLIASA